MPSGMVRSTPPVTPVAVAATQPKGNPVMVINWNPTSSRPTRARYVPRHAAASPRIDGQALAVLVVAAASVGALAGLYALRALSGLGL